MVTSSPRWTGTMTELPSVAPVLQLTAGAGGSTGEVVLLYRRNSQKLLLFSAALKPISMVSTFPTPLTMATTEGSYGSCG